MRAKILQVDAFTSRRFAGNPVAEMFMDAYARCDNCFQRTNQLVGIRGCDHCVDLLLNRSQIGYSR